MAAPVTGHPRVALVSATTAAVALIGGWTYAASVQAPGGQWGSASISALAASDTPHRWVMTSALLLTGLAHVVSARCLPGLHRVGRAVFAMGGLATLAVAAFPLPSRNDSSTAHVIAASASFLALALWPLWATTFRRSQRVAALVLTVLVASLALGWSGVHFGVHERLVAGALVVWPLVTAAALWWQAGHRFGGARARTGLGLVALTVASIFGGIGATTLAPVTAQTKHYEAALSLSPDPRDMGTLTATTVFGDIEVDFGGFGPGIKATPQVKASIAEVLSRPRVSVTSLQPGPLELAAATRSAAVGLAWRFALGSLTVALLAWCGVWALSGRNRRRRPSVLAGTLAAAVIANAVTGLATWRTYQPNRQQAFTSTGVLSVIQRNANLLGDVEARSTQVAPYLRNLIALSASLQQKYTPTSLEQPVALRLLLISDVHGGNSYPLLKQLIAQEKVDAVLDAGDLVNFGTAQEGEASGLFKGIASLGVPYFFVAGNHDATSATDTDLLRRLDGIPNVVLLQPKRDEFTLADLGGLRIAGLNDPRWFGDDGKRTAEKQKPSIAAFTSAYSGQAEPDLILGHEPSSVTGLKAGVLINGHMHTPDLEGNRIQVGTFTGGGPLTHFVAQEEGAELVGQPSAFDIVNVTPTCRLGSMTRYRFRDVIEGRPVYDSVSLINGDQIDTRPVDPSRTCGTSGGASVLRTTLTSQAK